MEYDRKDKVGGVRRLWVWCRSWLVVVCGMGPAGEASAAVGSRPPCRSP